MQANQICLQASRIAKGGTGMVAIAGMWLNTVLDDLFRIRNLKVNRETASILLTPAAQYGPFDLPTKYLRTYDMFYPLPVSGGGTAGGSTTQFLNSVTMEQFDSEFKSPSIADYPYEFATDLSETARTASANGSGQLFVYPQTSGNITITHRYMIERDAIVNPESSSTVPWFPQWLYLVNATAAHMFGTTGDDRHAEYIAMAEKLLAPYLIQEGDEQRTVQNVQLDQRHFKFHRNLRPTKSQPL